MTDDPFFSYSFRKKLWGRWSEPVQLMAGLRRGKYGFPVGWLRQAIVFDGNGENAKLSGVGYIIASRLFGTLREEEKKFWHSLACRVKSGKLIAPGLPRAARHELVEKAVKSTGMEVSAFCFGIKQAAGSGLQGIFLVDAGQILYLF